MRRREFLKYTGGSAMAASALAALPLSACGGGTTRSAAVAGRTLVLVELAGGNDGLNTIVPYRDPLYHALRPTLALGAGECLDIGDDLAMHQSLKPLMPAFDAQEMAIVQGVGYPEPNRSHFRSIEIWDTATDSDDYSAEGWIARGLSPARAIPQRPVNQRAADAIVLGGRGGFVLGGGPLQGGQLTTLTLQDPEQFIRQVRQQRPTRSAPTQASGHNALQHVLEVEAAIQRGADQLEARLAQAPSLPVSFPKSTIGQQLAQVARLIVADLGVPVFKISHKGFDTHARQKNAHRRLLSELAEGIAAFKAALEARDHWSDTVLMTYSEFGRRPKENGSRGTDHGTAAPHLLIGAKVRGGIYGERPNLRQLDGGDLVHTVDFRSIYATLASSWWGLPPARFGLDGHTALPLLTG
ncbi:MAG: DUF1501 domain-containing protein [Bradymonadia bacterium]